MPGKSYRAIITIQDEIEDGGGRPDQGLPGQGLHPGHRPPGQGRPPRPDQGLPGGGGRPDQELPEPPHAGHLPVWPIDPNHPIAPPSPGHPLPPVDPPPGTIWPPLPPGEELPEGKAVVLVAIEGVGYRYVVIQIGDQPDQELPGEGEEGEGEGEGGHPGNRPPGSGAPPRPDQGLPGGQPHPGNRPPGQGAPPRPGQGLPPTPQPKPVGRR